MILFNSAWFSFSCTASLNSLYASSEVSTFDFNFRFPVIFLDDGGTHRTFASDGETRPALTRGFSAMVVLHAVQCPWIGDVWVNVVIDDDNAADEDDDDNAADDDDDDDDDAG